MLTFDPPSPSLPSLIPSLPDELSILCIARLPHLHYPSLAGVSRSWRHLLRSPHLFSVRQTIGASQQVLLIKLNDDDTQEEQLYFLDLDRRNHASPLTPLLPPPVVCPIEDCSTVTLGHDLYLIGEHTVQIYDLRFNSWRRGLPTLTPHRYPIVGVISGQIYVVGGGLSIVNNWVEAFDAEKESWRLVSSPLEIRVEMCLLEIPSLFKSMYAVFGGKLFVKFYGQNGVVFDPAEAESTEVQS